MIGMDSRSSNRKETRVKKKTYVTSTRQMTSQEQHFNPILRLEILSSQTNAEAVRSARFWALLFSRQSVSDFRKKMAFSF
jgi:hypothetical protein